MLLSRWQKAISFCGSENNSASTDEKPSHPVKPHLPTGFLNAALTDEPYKTKTESSVQGTPLPYLNCTVFGAGCKQTAGVREAEVQNLVVVLLQGLHFNARDGVVEPLELIVPGDGSWNTSRVA